MIEEYWRVNSSAKSGGVMKIVLREHFGDARELSHLS